MKFFGACFQISSFLYKIHQFLVFLALTKVDIIIVSGDVSHTPGKS